MGDNESRERQEEAEESAESEPEEGRDALADDAASKSFFEKSAKDLVPDEIETKQVGPKTPMDSPSVQFFGEHLEDYVENADDVVISPAPRSGPDESPSVQFFGERLSEGKSENEDENEDEKEKEKEEEARDEEEP